MRIAMIISTGLLAALSGVAQAAVPVRVENATAGISIEPPAGWRPARRAERAGCRRKGVRRRLPFPRDSTVRSATGAR